MYPQPRATASLQRLARERLRRAGVDITRVSPVRYLSWAMDTAPSEPPSPERLQGLRDRYREADPAVIARSYWDEQFVADRALVLDDRFRDESLYVWQYIRGESSARLREAEYRYFAYLTYLEGRDHRGLLPQLVEDGAFGAPIFDFPGRPPVSRDLLDSVNELLYLDRKLDIVDRSELRVLDIGAGYGRLAHRMAQLVPGLADYACVDAIPESTYACERYLRHRGVAPPCRVIELPDFPEQVGAGGFDLAVNIHSFSEMPAAAIEYWVTHIAEAGIPNLLVIPNAPTTVESVEADGRRIDMAPALAEAGYQLVDVEPIIDDEADRTIVGVHDHFHLFRLDR